MKVPEGMQLPVVMLNRVLVAGGFEGFQELHDAGLIGSMVEAAVLPQVPVCSPDVKSAFTSALASAAKDEPNSTVAELTANEDLQPAWVQVLRREIADNATAQALALYDTQRAIKLYDSTALSHSWSTWQREVSYAAIAVLCESLVQKGEKLWCRRVYTSSMKKWKDYCEHREGHQSTTCEVWEDESSMRSAGVTHLWVSLSHCVSCSHCVSFSHCASLSLCIFL